MKLTKRIGCLLLALVLVLGYFPVTRANAAQEDGLCAHHTVHTPECGYQAAVAEQPCTHACTEQCTMTETVTCLHDHEAEGCTLIPADGETPEQWSCGHVCSVEGGCITRKCAHVCSYEDCGYAAAVPGTPCTYTCAECAEQEPDEAVLTVQAMIDALPAVEVVSALSTEEQGAVYNNTLVPLWQAYDPLTQEQKAQLDTTRKVALETYFTTLTATADEPTITLDKSEVTVYVLGEFTSEGYVDELTTVQLTATVTPASATGDFSWDNIEDWKVEVDENGVVRSGHDTLFQEDITDTVTVTWKGTGDYAGLTLTADCQVTVVHHLHNSNGAVTYGEAETPESQHIKKTACADCPVGYVKEETENHSISEGSTECPCGANIVATSNGAHTSLQAALKCLTGGAGLVQDTQEDIILDSTTVASGGVLFTDIAITHTINGDFTIVPDYNGKAVTLASGTGMGNITGTLSVQSNPSIGIIGINVGSIVQSGGEISFRSGNNTPTPTVGSVTTSSVFQLGVYLTPDSGVVSEIWTNPGAVTGNVTVKSGGQLYLKNGAVGGTITLEAGSKPLVISVPSENNKYTVDAPLGLLAVAEGDAVLNPDNFTHVNEDYSIIAKEDGLYVVSSYKEQISVETLDTVPEQLANAYPTVKDLEEELEDRVTVTAGYTADHVHHYDVHLEFSLDGGITWTEATVDNYPDSGITVVLPYPEGTGKNTHTFTAVHMFTEDSERLGTKAGAVEYPAVTKTDAGLKMTLNGLSPVTIAWKEIKTGTSDTVADTSNPKTGDPIPWAFATLLLTTAALMAVAAGEKKKFTV